METSFDSTCPKTLCSLSCTPMMLYIKWLNSIKIDQLASEVFRFGSRYNDDNRPLLYYKFTCTGELKAWLYFCKWKLLEVHLRIRMNNVLLFLLALDWLAIIVNNEVVNIWEKIYRNHVKIFRYCLMWGYCVKNSIHLTKIIAVALCLLKSMMKHYSKELFFINNSALILNKFFMPYGCWICSSLPVSVP